MCGNHERGEKGLIMGGGSGAGRGLTPDELKALEQKAKSSMKDRGATGKCNVFISFVEEDLNDMKMLRGQAKNQNSDIEFNDWSLQEPFDSEKAEYIRRGIRERIRQCSVTVVYISDKTTHSKWVDWETRTGCETPAPCLARARPLLPCRAGAQQSAIRRDRARHSSPGGPARSGVASA